MNSPTWRRRYFRLLASELRLFKSDSESDAAKPLTTATLAGAIVSEAYEESAVQGSWKLLAGGKVSVERSEAEPEILTGRTERAAKANVAGVLHVRGQP